MESSPQPCCQHSWDLVSLSAFFCFLKSKIGSSFPQVPPPWPSQPALVSTHHVHQPRPYPPSPQSPPSWMTVKPPMIWLQAAFQPHPYTDLPTCPGLLLLRPSQHGREERAWTSASDFDSDPGSGTAHCVAMGRGGDSLCQASGTRRGLRMWWA